MKFIKELSSWVLPAVFGILIAFLIKLYIFQFVKIDGVSMAPNLKNNETVVVSKISKIKRFSVIVFDAHGEDPVATKSTDYVKRVIGLPGDKIRFGNGKLWINGKEIPQKFISNYEKKNGTGEGDLRSLSVHNNWGKGIDRVPKNNYFVLGDHRSVSNDSRYWGFVHKNKIMGVVDVPFWDANPLKKNINNI